MISIVAGTTVSAWCPLLSRRARQVWLWSAYWRLRPLWAALRQVIPEVTLPRPPGVRLNIRYRVDRRVIEIRDAELVLRAYSPPEVPGRPETAARSAGLDADTAVAVAEAAVIAAALAARCDGRPPRIDGTSGDVINLLPGNDLRAEVLDGAQDADDGGGVAASGMPMAAQRAGGWRSFVGGGALPTGRGVRVA
ncbi:MAG TPA: DUF6545 domain-containing protein, partial [Streptosporangiaceae bacterium]|nr:DUF6545 domain-containing protein [Streptosporangiaceae bacterium]